MKRDSLNSGNLHSRHTVDPEFRTPPDLPTVLSRRQLLRGAGGAAAIGAAATAALGGGRTSRAAGPGIGLALPIPSTLEVFPGVEIHVLAPPFTGPDSDPGSVYNFHGTTGIAFISGEVERKNLRTGEVATLPYLFSDMRFMQGEFEGRDAHVRNATFAFI